MKMNVLDGGRLRINRRVYVPDAQPGEIMEIPVPCLLFRHDQGNVLFDTGCHPSVSEDADARWGNLAKTIHPIMGPDENVIFSLAAMELGPSDIDVVVNSHLHMDHCGCNAFFKNATIVVHERELEVAKMEGAAANGYLDVDWDHDNPFDVLDGERDLFGDERLVLLPLPGHTPGSLGALANLDRDGQFLAASDAVPVRSCLEHDVIPRNTWNIDDNLKSNAEVRRLQAQGATILFGHDDRQWRSLRKGVDGYR